MAGLVAMEEGDSVLVVFRLFESLTSVEELEGN